MSDGANFGNIQQKRIATYYDEKSSEISSLANLRISIEIYEWIDPSLSCGLNFHALIHWHFLLPSFAIMHVYRSVHIYKGWIFSSYT